jgi:hypothetical protein
VKKAPTDLVRTNEHDKEAINPESAAGKPPAAATPQGTGFEPMAAKFVDVNDNTGQNRV